MSAVGDIFRAISRRAAGAASTGASGGLKALLHGWGVLPAAGLFALLDIWDYTHERDRIAEEYDSEIAAKLGKHPGLVTGRDMETVAQENPVIGDALRRARWKRNLGIAVTTVCMIGAFALAVSLGPVAVGALIAHGIVAASAQTALTFIATGLIGFCSFMMAERAAKEISCRALKLKEPEVEFVERMPALQPALSLPSQIRLLARLQNHRVKISKEQIFAAFIAADPLLAADITSQFKAPFAMLSPELKTKAADSLGPRYRLCELTEGINNRTIRAQELAFAVMGQQSGVEKLESSPLSSFERTQAELQQKLAVTKDKLAELSLQAKEKAAVLGCKMKDGALAAVEKGKQIAAAAKNKMPFMKAHTCCAVPANQHVMQEMVRSAPAQTASL